MNKIKYKSLLLSLMMGTAVMATSVVENAPVDDPIIDGIKRKINLHQTKNNVMVKLSKIGDKYAKPKLALANLPTKVDLTPYATIVDQGDLGSCTANSAAQCTLVRELYQLHLDNPNQNIADLKQEVNIFSRLFHYRKELMYDIYGDFNHDDATDLEDNGSSIGTSLLVMHKVGVPQESYWSYDTSKLNVKPSDEAFAHTNDNMDNAETPEMLNAGDLTGIKTSLAHGIPVQIGAMIYSQFQSEEAADTGFITVPKFLVDYEIGGHATAILGYDDNLTYGKYTGYFIVANSWGQNWGATINGQRGFYYLPYKYVARKDLVFDLGQYSQFSFSRSKK